MPRGESVALLRTRHAMAEAEADRLAAVLGDLPLALAQAAGFLAETGMSVDRYLDLLDTSAHELLDEGTPATHPDSLAAVVRTSTDRLAGVDLAALALLRITAFLAPEPIPSEMLTRWSPPPELAGLARHRAVSRLGRYGLARVDEGFQLHRLTQAIVRGQLGAEAGARCRALAESMLVAARPAGDPRDSSTWPAWATILPHVLALELSASDSPSVRELACDTGWYLALSGRRPPVIRPGRPPAPPLARTPRPR